MLSGIGEEGKTCQLQTRADRSLRFHDNDFGEGTSATHSPVFPGSSPSGKSDGHILEHGFCLDGTAKLTQSHSKCKIRDPQFSQAHGGHRLKLKSELNRGKARPPGSPNYDGPTPWDVSGEGTSTLNPGSSSNGLTHTEETGGTSSSDQDVSGEGTSTLNPGSSSNGLTHTEETGGTSSSDQVQGGPAAELQIDSFGSADENGDRGTGGTHSSDHLPTEPGSEDCCPVHGVREDNWQRLTTMVDPLLAAIFQGACSLLAYESSNGSSLARDAIYYLLVFVCLLGFLFAFGGRWFRCAKMEGIGLLFAGLGFLMTMALVVIYKIG